MARADDRERRQQERAERERKAKEAADMAKAAAKKAAADAKKRADDAAKARIAKRTPLHGAGKHNAQGQHGHKGGQGAHAKPSPWSLKRKG